MTSIDTDFLRKRDFSIEVRGWREDKRVTATYLVEAYVAGEALEEARVRARAEYIGDIYVCKTTGSRLVSETTIDVAVWDEQTGSWFDLTEVKTEQDAYERIVAYKIGDAADGVTRRYLVRTTTTQEA